MRDVRRVAAHEVDVCNERILNNAVVELSDGVVKECYTFSGAVYGMVGWDNRDKEKF